MASRKVQVEGNSLTVTIDGNRFQVQNLSEEDSGDAEMVTTSQVGHQLCSLCPGSSDHMKRHIICNHLPWFVYFETCCPTCAVNCGTLGTLKKFHTECLATRDRDQDILWWTSQCRFALLRLTLELGLSNLEGLLHFVRINGLYPRRQNGRSYNSPFTKPEEELILQFEFMTTNDFAMARTFDPSNPIRVGSLLHWRILANILTHLTPEARMQFRSHQSEY